VSYSKYFTSFQITAVCDFLNYLRYIERGLVKSSGMYFIINNVSEPSIDFMVTPCINNILHFNFQLMHTTLKM